MKRTVQQVLDAEVKAAESDLASAQKRVQSAAEAVEAATARHGTAKQLRDEAEARLRRAKAAADVLVGKAGAAYHVDDIEPAEAQS